MPLNFPEIWLKRVIYNLTTQDQAPWLDGIAELDVPVAELGAGAASESNIIHIPTSMFEPDVLINNTSYPIALQAYTDDEVTVQLDKFQTKVTTLSDDQIIGASYPRIDAATRSHTVAILKKKFAKAIHALAPNADATNTPVISATGTAGSDGRTRLIYDDLVTMKQKLDDIETPAQGRRLVLCTDHMNDLLLDRKNFGDQLVNYRAGQPAPNIAGFELYSYVANPYFDSSNKKVAFASAPGGTDHRASVVFYDQNVAKKTGMTKQYFAPSAQDPQNQTNKLNYRHYFIVVPMMSKYLGAITSHSA